MKLGKSVQVVSYTSSHLLSAGDALRIYAAFEPAWNKLGLKTLRRKEIPEPLNTPDSLAWAVKAAFPGHVKSAWRKVGQDRGLVVYDASVTDGEEDAQWGVDAKGRILNVFKVTPYSVEAMRTDEEELRHGNETLRLQAQAVGHHNTANQCKLMNAILQRCATSEIKSSVHLLYGVDLNDAWARANEILKNKSLTLRAVPVEVDDDIIIDAVGDIVRGLSEEAIALQTRIDNATPARLAQVGNTVSKAQEILRKKVHVSLSALGASTEMLKGLIEEEDDRGANAMMAAMGFQ